MRQTRVKVTLLDLGDRVYHGLGEAIELRAPRLLALRPLLGRQVAAVKYQYEHNHCCNNDEKGY